MSDLPPFRYLRPTGLAGALTALAERGAWPYAGGTDLLVALSERRPWVRSVRVLVDIKGVPEADGITESTTELRIGALTTARQLGTSRAVRRSARALAEAAQETSSPLLRGRGTLGGNLVTPHPAGDMTTALLALGALVEIGSPGAGSLIPVDEFLAGLAGRGSSPFLILAVRILKCRRSAFVKVGSRRGFGRSVVAVAVALRGRSHSVALGGVARRPLLVSADRGEDMLRLFNRSNTNAADDSANRLDLAKVLIARAERRALAR